MQNKHFALARKILGLTQTELADALGYVGHVNISRRETFPGLVTKRDLLALEALLRRNRKWKEFQGEAVDKPVDKTPEV